MQQSLKSFFFLMLLALGLSFPPSQQAWASAPPATFADLAEKLLPSVVNISTTQTVERREDMPEFEFDFPEGSPFQKFFEEFNEQQNRHLPQGGADAPKSVKRKATSLGSGFVIDPAGYIVTNYHVIQDADEITVILQDDTNLTAKLVGKDKKTDLALLKVDSKKPLSAVTFGESDKVRVGDWILTIGNPFGLGGTVTKGIISARARDINSGPYDDFLQTDAPINRGNSGGPMFNMDGEVIGVNTAIYSPSGGSVGIGFAIPSSMAKGVIDQLKTVGFTKRGWLGVHIQAVTPEIAESLGLSKPMGALVSSITAEGPAAKAKVEVGDVITSFDGKDITEMHRLPRVVAETAVDKTVSMKVLRKGKEIELKAKVGQLDQDKDEVEADATADKAEPAQPQSDKIEVMGLSVTPVTDSLRKRYSLTKDVVGLVVTSVAQEGPAADTGLLTGDVITEAGQEDLKSAGQLTELAQKAKKQEKPLLLLVDRKGELRFVAISLDKKKRKNGDRDK